MIRLFCMLEQSRSGLLKRTKLDRFCLIDSHLLEAVVHVFHKFFWPGTETFLSFFMILVPELS